MDATERVSMAQLDEADAADGLKLSSEAHWNQNEADWRFFLAKGIVFGMRDRDRRVVATAALLPYTGAEAWISMVLVTESFRRQGLATRLVDACLTNATGRGLTTWLDATPAGAAVYGPLGFAPTIELRRLRLENSSAAKNGAPLPAGQPSDLIAFDANAMGFSRRVLLNELIKRPGSRLVSNGDAMALVRDGRAARHIGPLFADGAVRALAMVHDIAARETRPLIIDAVASQDVFLKGLTDDGWGIERPFQRMRLGRASSQPAKLPFAVAGPEYG
jgi:GNAT superfamily N-acetyltransferase